MAFFVKTLLESTQRGMENTQDFDVWLNCEQTVCKYVEKNSILRKIDHGVNSWYHRTIKKCLNWV